MECVRGTGYRVGAWVYDETKGMVGRLMGREGSRVQLRPVGGGIEWESPPGRIRIATAEERRTAGVAEETAA